MKKRLIITLASVFIMGIAGTAFAAENPFSEVPAQNWAYDAVKELYKAGIVEGNNGSDKTMTRYEMAKIVEKAMSKAEKADSKKKDLIYRLSVEFSPELFGIRAAKPELAQSNIKFSGTLDTRFTAVNYYMKDYSGANGYGNGAAGSIKSTANNGSFRLRLQADAKVYDKATATIRLVNMSPYQNISNKTSLPYQNSWANFGSATPGGNGLADANGGSTIMMDRIYLTSKIGTVTTQVGRLPLAAGNTNSIVDSTVMSVDGIKFSVPVDGFDISATHGNVYKAQRASVIDISKQEGKAKFGAGYFQLRNYNYDKASWGMYGAGADLKTANLVAQQVPMQIMYASVGYKFDQKFSLNAEVSKNNASYAQNSIMEKQDTMYNIVALYGDQIFTKAGQSNFKVQYWSVGRDALGQDNSKDFYGKCLSTFDLTTTDKYYTGFGMVYTYAFDKNMTGTLQRTKITDHGSKDNSFQYVRAMVNVKF